MNRPAYHQQNQQALDQAETLANEAGLVVRLNRSTQVGFRGHARYVLLRPGDGDFSIRSRRCIGWGEARYARYYKPSAIGEARAITALTEVIKEWGGRQ